MIIFYKPPKVASSKMTSAYIIPNIHIFVPQYLSLKLINTINRTE